MLHHHHREEAIRRCTEHGKEPAQLAGELGIAPSTLRGWLRISRFERELQALRQERDAQQQRQETMLEELKLLLDQEDQAAYRVAVTDFNQVGGRCDNPSPFLAENLNQPCCHVFTLQPWGGAAIWSKMEHRAGEGFTPVLADAAQPLKGGSAHAPTEIKLI